MLGDAPNAIRLGLVPDDPLGLVGLGMVPASLRKLGADADGCFAVEERGAQPAFDLGDAQEVRIGGAYQTISSLRPMLLSAAA